MFVLLGAALALGGAALIALTMIVADFGDARARIGERYQREAVQRAIMHNHRERRPPNLIARPRNPAQP